ncbi:MAG TPA: VIT domain-containing protein [Actinomycetes bacterium]|nr:VIT domain-containing protein [Actinomycetes bacterium]
MTSYLPLLNDHELGTAGEAGVGAITTERGNLPLQAIDVDATITGLVARVVLTQTFANRFDQPLEASYIFPLPDRAAVTGFRMEAGERVVEGVLKERGRARAEYDTAVKEGRRASIAEEERPGVFTMRVGNLLPGEEVKVRLVMTGPLPWEEGEATFRFPLVVAPRYIPGAPLEGEPVGLGTEPDTDAVPDASRITPPVLLPGFPNPVDLSIRARIDPAGLQLGGVRSSLHTVVEEERDGVRTLRVEPGERANRDFVLRLQTGSAAVATGLTAAEDAEGGRGTFALALLPPVGVDTGTPRDLVFVLDRSGSMGGWKMVAARRAVARMVDALTERDRFAVLAFDNLIETPPQLGESGRPNPSPQAEWGSGGLEPSSPARGNGLQVAGDHARFQAVDYLSRLEARGGTEMAAPLSRALELLTGPAGGEPEGRDRALVLVTDGQVGNEDQILRLLAPRLGGVRVYAVGVDTAVNEGFLKRLAGLGGGAYELVESEDRLDAVMDRVHRRIGAPVLTGLELEPAGFDMDRASLAPRRLPDLFAGSALVVSGRFEGAPEGAVVVRGRDAAGQPWSATVPVTRTESSALTATWARAHLRDLEDRYATDPSPDRDLERRIVETSLRFGVLCRFTAFVAADVQVVNEGGVVHRVLQPVEAPAGWTMFERAGLAAAAMPMARMAGGPFGGVAGSSVGRTAGPRRSLGKLDARLGGLPGRVGPRRSGGFASQPLGGADLTPYRHRAAQLATLLESDRPLPTLVGPSRATAGSPGGPRIPGDPQVGIDLERRLGLVRVGVEALVADLESVDAVDEEVRPLRDLVTELGSVPAPAGSDRARLERLRERALAVLRAFAAAPGPGPGQPPVPARPPDPQRDPHFWRR